MKLRIKVLQGKPHGHCFTFRNGEFMFGRGPECDVRPNSDLVSRQHCLLKVTDETAKVRDLGSRNGTLVNGQLVTAERQLAHGDKLHVGPLVLQVLLEPDVVSLKDTVVSDSETTAEWPNLPPT
jgi:pSer/pThr/pTyr-binding forkhead associated (FHA) protein